MQMSCSVAKHAFNSRLRIDPLQHAVLVVDQPAVVRPGEVRIRHLRDQIPRVAAARRGRHDGKIPMRSSLSTVASTWPLDATLRVGIVVGVAGDRIQLAFRGRRRRRSAFVCNSSMRRCSGPAGRCRPASTSVMPRYVGQPRNRCCWPFLASTAINPARRICRLSARRT